jgi:hypothetical protein
MMHAMRSYELSTSVLQLPKGRQPFKWQYLWFLRSAWANETMLTRSVLPLAMGQWTLWRAVDPTFALCDSPVVVHRNGLIAVLSPRLLLQIDVTVERAEDHWILRDEVPPRELDSFRGAILRNTFKELVAWDRATLEGWTSDPRYRKRVEAVSSRERRDADFAEAAERVFWGLMGFSRVPDDFEKWAPMVRDEVLQSDRCSALLSELQTQSAHGQSHAQSRSASTNSSSGKVDP